MALNIDAIGEVTGALERLLYQLGDLNQHGECPFCAAKIKGDGHCESEDCAVSDAIAALEYATQEDD